MVKRDCSVRVPFCVCVCVCVVCICARARSLCAVAGIDSWSRQVIGTWHWEGVGGGLRAFAGNVCCARSHRCRPAIGAAAKLVIIRGMVRETFRRGRRIASGA